MTTAARRRNQLMQRLYGIADAMQMTKAELLAALCHEAAALARDVADEATSAPITAGALPQKPDFVMPGQIWRSDLNPTFRVKIEETAGYGPNATAQPVDPSGQPERPGQLIHVKMDGPRALLGYTRDHDAEQAELLSQQ